MRTMQRIGIFVERHRAWGRRVCEGICAFAQERHDWSLAILERADFKSPAALASFDGFISRVPDAEIADALRRTGRPVADLTCEDASQNLFPHGVRQDNVEIGRLAARHFLDHLFENFAFCGYAERRFSRERELAFVESLRQSRKSAAVYHAPAAALRDYDASTSRQETFARAPDARSLARWLKSLPKPVAVLCANDYRATQLLKVCADAGLAVPGDVAVLGIDNDTLVCNFATPTLSSIDPDAESIGRSAAEMLSDALRRRSASRSARIVKPKGLVARDSTETFPVKPAWLSDALVFIRRNVGRVRASDVYAAVGRSHTRVDAAFRDRLGTTVQAELRRVALDEAQRLLETTALPVADIAARTGFSTLQYFSNVFAASRGHAPTRHRASSRSPAPRRSPRPTPPCSPSAATTRRPETSPSRSTTPSSRRSSPPRTPTWRSPATTPGS